MAGKKQVTGTDFYKEKGFRKSIVLHVTESLYEKLRLYSFKRKSSLQETLRSIVEEKLK